jgi:hypothetical protein
MVARGFSLLCSPHVTPRIILQLILGDGRLRIHKDGPEVPYIR